jgi:hypothetical protein
MSPPHAGTCRDSENKAIWYETIFLRAQRFARVDGNDRGAIPRVNAQENSDPAAALAENPEKNSLSEKWDRLIYVPFRELQKVFDNQDASVVLPYAEYLDLMKRAIQAVPATTGNQDAVITSSKWTATVEKDLARVTAELKVNVIKENGWAVLPVAFGSAAIGTIGPDDGSVLLKGTGDGTYELLIKGAGQKSVTLELLTTVSTSPESRSFTIQCPPTGISELVCHHSGTRSNNQNQSASGSAAVRRSGRRRQDRCQSQSWCDESVHGALESTSWLKACDGFTQQRDK